MSITADQLVVAVSSRALFDLEKEHQLFEKKAMKPSKITKLSTVTIHCSLVSHFLS